MILSLDIVIYLLGLAFGCGGVVMRIKSLEKKVELHNGAMERIARAEADINNIKSDIQEIKCYKVGGKAHGTAI